MWRIYSVFEVKQTSKVLSKRLPEGFTPLDVKWKMKCGLLSFNDTVGPFLYLKIVAGTAASAYRVARNPLQLCVQLPGLGVFASLRVHAYIRDSVSHWMKGSAR